MTTTRVAITDFTVSITLMQCPVCGVHYGIDERFRELASKNGHGWYCTNGHGLSYRESIERDKEIKALKERLAAEQGWTAHLTNNLDAERKGHAATKGQLTKAKNRAQAGVCQDCNRTFQNVARHMATKHGARS